MPAALAARHVAPSVKARQYAAIAALVSGQATSLRQAAEDHGVDRHSLSDNWSAMLQSGLLSAPAPSKPDHEALASAAKDVLSCLCKLAKGCVESLQALPTRPHEMDKMQMSQLKLSLDTLDRLGLLPTKAKDVARKEGTGALIDMIPMDELLPEPDSAEPSEPGA